MKIWTRARDKPLINYRMSRAQMGDFLSGCGDPIGKLSPHRKNQLRRRLERYMASPRASLPINLDMGTCILIINGADESGHLYYYFK